MAEEPSFVDLIRRVRVGDEEAIEKLVRQYEPVIRVAIRVRLSDSGLRCLFDSMDISQSVLGNFFARAASGQFDLDSPQQLVNLLVVMARNRLTNHVLQQRTARRDHRRNRQAFDGNADAVAADPSPSDAMSVKELLQAFRSRLSFEETQLVDLRALGKAWPEIAAEMGGTPDGLRMSLGRTLDRIAQELRLDA